MLAVSCWDSFSQTIRMTSVDSGLKFPMLFLLVVWEEEIFVDVKRLSAGVWGEAMFVGIEMISAM